MEPTGSRSAPMGRPGGRRAWGGLVAVLTVVLLAAACDPILHPEVTVREDAGSGVTAAGLAGHGGHVVVHATRAGATVPGPGTWRVDRRTGAADQLPPIHRPTVISRDGARILLADGTVWADGTIIRPPATRFSSSVAINDDLTYGLYVGPLGGVRRWNVATGEITTVEDLAPRPPDHQVFRVHDISDDGRVVLFSVNRPDGVVVRILDTATGVATDRIGNQERITLADSGSLAVHHQLVYDEEPTRLTVHENWVELIDPTTGTVIRRHEIPLNFFTTATVAASGRAVWLTSTERSGFDSGCVVSPIPVSCVVARRLEVLSGAHGYQVLEDVDFGLPGDFEASSTIPVSLSRGGRLLAVIETDRLVGGFAGVVDRYADDRERLDVAGVVLRQPMISDDGSLVVSSAAEGGWFEHETAPSPSP